MQQQAAREREDATATRAKDRAKEFSQLSTPHLIPGTPFGWSSLGFMRNLWATDWGQKKRFFYPFLSFCPWPGYPFFILFLSSPDFSSILEILFYPFLILFLSSCPWPGYPFFILPWFFLNFGYPFFIIFLSFFNPFYILLAAKWIKIGFSRYKRQRAEEKCRILSFFYPFFYPFFILFLSSQLQSGSKLASPGTKGKGLRKSVGFYPFLSFFILFLSFFYPFFILFLSSQLQSGSKLAFVPGEANFDPFCS